MKTSSKVVTYLFLLILLLQGVFNYNPGLAKAAGAREYEVPPCYDITGQTQPVLVSGVNNGGVINFDDAGVAAQYQACVRMDKFGADAKPVRLEGWVWDNNMGWISLYCPGGAGATNLDIPCGSYSYGINFTVTGADGLGNFTSVALSGNAWGDNIGWISFDNPGTHQMKPLPSGANRGQISAGSPATDKYAWTDTLGWLDWSNVWFHWQDTDPPVPDPNVKKYLSVCSTKDLIPATSSPPDYGTSYSSNGNGPMKYMAINGPNLYLVNINAPKNVTRFDVSTGSPVVAASFSSALANEKAPLAVDLDVPGNRVYMVSYSFATDFGVVALKPTDLSKLWSVPVPGPVGNMFDDMLADPLSGAAWVLSQTGTEGHLYKFRGSDGVLLQNLAFPAGIYGTQVVLNKTGNFLWVLTTNNKFLKINNAGAYFNGTYAASLYDPGIGGGALMGYDFDYDSVDNALWVSNVVTSELIKLKAGDASPFNGTLAASKWVAPAGVPYIFHFDPAKKVVWAAGGSRIGKMDSVTGANLGVYPDVGVVNPGGELIADNLNNVIWSTDGGSPGKLWKTGRDPVMTYSVGSPKCNCDLDGTCPINTDDTKIPPADPSSGDRYNIEITYVDGGMAIPDSDIDQCTDKINMYTTKPGTKNYCAYLQLVWEDDVDYDQTTSISQQQASAKFNDNNSGATRKPLTYNLFGASDFTYSPLYRLWGANVSSYAPTSDRNITAGMQNEKFYYNDYLGGYDAAKSNQNLLKLPAINLLLYKYSAGPGLPGKCVYGTTLEDKCIAYNYVTTASTLSFNPLVLATKLAYVDNGKEMNFFSFSNVDAAQKFLLDGITVAANAVGWNMHFKIGLTDNSAYELRLVDTFPKAELNPTPADPGITDSVDKADISAANWIGQMFTTGKAAIISDIGPYLYSKVTYTLLGTPIAYWGPKLPRIKGGALVNPVAKVEGNVYLTDFSQKATGPGTSLKSLGNVSSKMVRETIVRNVAKYTNGFSGIYAMGDKYITDPTQLGILTELVAGKVYYLKDNNLTFTCPNPSTTGCVFDHNVTFIVENGNIFINSNITTTNNAQVGLIALRDLVGNKQNQGFLYIDKNVTWLHNVQIYADRLIQSYDASAQAFDPTSGLFINDEDDFARQTRFGNQLVIEGTVSSMNGIGNASGTTPTDENGTPVNISGGTYCLSYKVLTNNICRARVVDLNYLRYYAPGLEICPNNVPRDQKRKSISPDFGCDPTVAGYDINASDMYSSTTPDFDLVAGGGKGQRSQYFSSKGMPVTLANEYPVNFYYVPIARDLAGFEADQSYR